MAQQIMCLDYASLSIASCSVFGRDELSCTYYSIFQVVHTHVLSVNQCISTVLSPARVLFPSSPLLCYIHIT